MQKAIESAEETIVSLVESLKPAIMAAARNYGVEFDDLLQNTAEAILLHRDRILSITSFSGMRNYCIVIAYGFCRKQSKWRTEHPLTSIDTPMFDCDCDLVDTLAADDTLIDHTEEDQKAAIVHQALHRLPLEEQLYMSRVYGLNSFQPAGRIERDPTTVKQVIIAQNARRHLRKDHALTALLVGGAR